MNPRAKGIRGEQEVAAIFKEAVYSVMTKRGCEQAEIHRVMRSIQRNTLQSANGGCDLTNTFGLAVEVKRSEILQLPAWWRQTVEQADRNNEWPVLIYRQNKGKWKVKTFGSLPVGPKRVRIPVTIELEEFKKWLRLWIDFQLDNGFEVRN